MTFRIITSTSFDFESFRTRRSKDLGPGHLLDTLAGQLDAAVCQPGDVEANRLDKLLAVFHGRAEQWAAARTVVSRSRANDVIYATGEDIGITVAANILLRSPRTKVAIYFLAPRRIKSRLAAKVISLLPIGFMAVSGTKDKVEFLESLLKSTNVHLASEQTDLGFFRPADSPSKSDRPLLVSCGLEQRDYTTLAKAVEGLDVDVRVCAASPNLTDKTTYALPEVTPENMEVRHYEFSELRDLYRDADITVVPLLPNSYSAGLTTMLEAIACSSPVIMTRTPGLGETFIDSDLVIGIDPQSSSSLKRAIQSALENPSACQDRADRALDYVSENHSPQAYSRDLVESLKKFADG